MIEEDAYRKWNFGEDQQQNSIIVVGVLKTVTYFPPEQNSIVVVGALKTVTHFPTWLQQQFKFFRIQGVREIISFCVSGFFSVPILTRWNTVDHENPSINNTNVKNKNESQGVKLWGYVSFFVSVLF